MKIRTAQAADAPALAQIYRHHVLHGTGTFEEVPPDAAQMRARHAAVQEGGHPWLVAEEDGPIIGYAYAKPYHTRSAYRFTLEDSIYIAPDAVGRGVGQALLAALIDAARASGARQMMAVIGDSANHASIRLHERHGFTPVGTAHAIGVKFGRPLDVVYMQRAL